MLKESRDSFNDAIRDEALALFSLESKDFKELEGFESFVFECRRGAAPFILKITHVSQKGFDELVGIQEWVAFLAQGGASVARPMLSLKGNLVEQIGEGGMAFFAYAFAWAPGEIVMQEDWTPELIRVWGRETGKLHRLSSGFKPREPRFTPNQWPVADCLNLEKYIPAVEEKAIRKGKELIAAVSALPKTATNFGLIHSDLHNHNFHWQPSGSLTFFDFDDCEYHFLINDIAVTLHSILTKKRCEGTKHVPFVRHFLDHYLQGYRQEFDLPPGWAEQIPLLLRLRHLLIYVIFHQITDLENMDEERAEILDKFRKEIEEETPIVEMDFRM